MKYIRAIFKDKFLLLGAFFILLPSSFLLFCGEQGRVFIVTPVAIDPQFSQTILYMFEHTIDGAEALVINRPYPDEKKNKLPSYLTQRKIPLFWGGPVGDTDMIFIMKLNGENRPNVKKFDTWVIDDPLILDKIEKSPLKYRIYIGSANWQALQFEMERLADIWFFGVKRSEIFPKIFDQNKWNSKDLWLKALEKSDFYKKQNISRLSRA